MTTSTTSNVKNHVIGPDDDDMRLDRWLAQNFPDTPKGECYKLLRTGQLRVNSKRVKGNTRIYEGDVLRLPPMLVLHNGHKLDKQERSEKPSKDRTKTNRPAPGSAHAIRHWSDKEAIDAMIIYEDDDLIALNKPPGLSTQGGLNIQRHIDGMLQQWAAGTRLSPKLVHRLDRETSGILVVAKRRSVAAELAQAFRSRRSNKVYWAVVAHEPRPRQGRISTYLRKDATPGSGKSEIAQHGEEGAQHALTYYQVIDTLAGRATWLALKPVTGRTHQLRVHMMHIGHPIIGDDKYFNLSDWHLPSHIQNRLHLHARNLIIPRKDGTSLELEAPLAPHMLQSFKIFGFNEKEANQNLDPWPDARV